LPRKVQVFLEIKTRLLKVQRRIDPLDGEADVRDKRLFSLGAGVQRRLKALLLPVLLDGFYLFQFLLIPHRRTVMKWKTGILE